LVVPNEEILDAGVIAAIGDRISAPSPITGACLFVLATAESIAALPPQTS